MANMMLAAFPDQSSADKAVRDLQDSGFKPSDISVIMKTTQEEHDKLVGSKGGESARDTGSGTASGIMGGALIGGLAGLLYGVIALTFPGLGLILFGGPIAAALGLGGAAATTATGAVLGGATGGIVGLMSNLGLSDEDARFYETRIRDEGVVIAVPIDNANNSQVEDILTRNGADRIRTVDVDA